MTHKIDLESVIEGKAAAEYGEEFNSHVLEMWKTYLGMTDRISDRRERANAFFVTIHAGVFAGIGFLFEKQMYLWIVTLSLFAGIPFTFLWYRLVRSYKDLNSAKFKVVHAIEHLRPLKLFEAEWEAVGHGRDPARYVPFTKLELRVPLVLLGIYILVGVVAAYLICADSTQI